MRQLSSTTINEIQIDAARSAGDNDKITFQELSLRELNEGMRRAIHSVTRLPVVVWREPKRPDPPLPDATEPELKFHANLVKAYEAALEQRPENGHEIRGGTLWVEAQDLDDLGGILEEDYIHFSLADLEMPGPKHIDSVFDPPEYFALTQVYRRKHGPPPDVVLEMLSGKSHPVVLEV